MPLVSQVQAAHARSTHKQPLRHTNGTPSLLPLFRMMPPNHSLLPNPGTCPPILPRLVLSEQPL